MNLPNALALMRIVLAPILFFLLTYKIDDIHPSWIDYFATVVFSIAALSDFFDGYIARIWGQVTKLGAILDPLADKMLILAAFLGLLLLDRANAWIVYLILVREFFITGFRIVMISDNLNISASFAGKIKTLSQTIAIIFLLMQWKFADFILYISFFLTIYSGVEYVVKYYKARL